MSDAKKTSKNGTKSQPKLSKAQMQLMLIKKKQCDTIALHIVQNLLEPNINPEWLLQHLKHLNRNHMEDVIEERAVSKLCGYVLCSNPLTVIIKQRYCISTKLNKVYDITKRKNFCSSRCYGASNYLLEQMYTSPLWLRDKESVRTFKFLSEESMHKEESAGEEVIMKDKKADFEYSLKNKQSFLTDSKTNFSKIDYTKTDKPESKTECTNHEEIDKSENNLEKNVNENCTKESEQNDALKSMEIIDSMIETEKPIIKIDIKKPDIKNQVETLGEQENNGTPKILCNKSERGTGADSKCDEKRSDNGKKVSDKKEDKSRTKKVRRKEISSEDSLPVLINRIEKAFFEWVTEDTIKLLSGDPTEMQNIYDKVLNHERLSTLCEKLNRLQILNESEESKEERTKLQPLPDFSELREQSKTMELKVKAFFKGSTIIDPSEDDEKNDNAPSIVPLTEAYAPNTIRRKIFLDKLNKILPDLLYALTKTGEFEQKKIATKVLVSTFSISSGNIMFRNVEWTLVGLIIIKMLSLIHPDLQTSLATENAVNCLSMILMSYKLDQFYLDRFVTSLTHKIN